MCRGNDTAIHLPKCQQIYVTRPRYTEAADVDITTASTMKITRQLHLLSFPPIFLLGAQQH